LAASERLNHSSSLGRAGAHLVQLADHLQVLAAGEVLVHGRVLAGEPDQAAHLVRVLEHVHARHHGSPGVGAQQGGEDAHGGGLARAVGAEQAEDSALGDFEVDAVEGTYIAEGLHQALGIYGSVCHLRLSSLALWNLGVLPLSLAIVIPAWPGGGRIATRRPAAGSRSAVVLSSG